MRRFSKHAVLNEALNAIDELRNGIRVRTSDTVVHLASRDRLSHDWNDAHTRCGLAIHFCDLQTCRHENRHRGRKWSRVDRSEVTCLECMVNDPE